MTQRRRKPDPAKVAFEELTEHAQTISVASSCILVVLAFLVFCALFFGLALIAQ